MANFEKFSPSARWQYIEWLVDAKQDATRAKRLATAVEWIAEGKARAAARRVNAAPVLFSPFPAVICTAVYPFSPVLALPGIVAATALLVLAHAIGQRHSFALLSDLLDRALDAATWALPTHARRGPLGPPSFSWRRPAGWGFHAVGGRFRLEPTFGTGTLCGR